MPESSVEVAPPESALAASTDVVDGASVEVPSPTPELTVLLPCLDEAETLATCITKAQRCMAELGVEGEVVVADNGSTDGSQVIASALGARLVHVRTRGYGAALRAGIEAAHGRYVVMADADDSYDLDRLGPFLDELRKGTQLVMGNRFEGGIAPGVMPLLHKLGNPVLSLVGRTFFGIGIRDFHCGMRGFDRAAVEALDLTTTGMEFASELVVQASLNGLSIAEVPTTLSPDGRTRAPHLRTWRDGWRHLRFLLLYSPRWLFVYPGSALVALGLVLGTVLALAPRSVGAVTFDVHTLLACAVAVVLGTQLVLFGVAARGFAAALGLLPRTEGLDCIERLVSLERVLVAGLGVLSVGLVGWVAAAWEWRAVGFGALDTRASLRLAIPSAAAVIVGTELVFGSFLTSIWRLGARTRREV